MLERRLNLGIALAVVSVVIALGPIFSAVFLYRGDFAALVKPNIEELREKIGAYFPTVEYVGCEIVGSELSLRVMFNVTNNSDGDFKFNSMTFSVYCSEHKGVLLGSGHGVGFLLTISGRSSKIASVQVTFTADGLSHVLALHRGDTDFYVVLRNVVVVAQGVEVELGDEIYVGPVVIPS